MTPQGDVTPEQDLVENAPCGYFVTGLNRNIVNVDATLVKWLGSSATR